MLSLPLPLGLVVSVTLASSLRLRQSFMSLNSRGSVALAVIFFFATATSSPFFSICTISSTLRTEYWFFSTSLNSFSCIDGDSSDSSARAWPMSISRFFSAICIWAGNFSRRM